MSTCTLLDDPLFQVRQELLSRDERILLSHKRSAAIALRLGLTAHDIADMTPKFWAAHADPVQFCDTSAMTNVTVQYNVVIGTLLDMGKDRVDLEQLIADLLAYRIL